MEERVNGINGYIFNVNTQL